MSDQPQYSPDLRTLVALFYDDPQQLGEFTEVKTDAMPPSMAKLLAHDEHMTVTVESFHRSPVDVEVVETQINGEHYARRILLKKQSDGAVVQFGIVRLSFEHVSGQVRQEIESQSTPLGRVLIRHDVLRHVELVALWKIVPGPDLCTLFNLGPNPSPVYGRTALIYTNGIPAVELLEVASVESL